MPSDVDIGGRCAEGEYCPGGSEYPIPCDPGYYCHRPGLAEPVLQCAAGKYGLKLLFVFKYRSTAKSEKLSTTS